MDLNQAKYSNITADTTVKTGAGTIYGIIVNSHTSGTLKIWDNTASSGTVVMNTYTFASGSQYLSFPNGISFYTGLRADIGGTVDLTILYS
jgi:hypothetical protein